MAALVKPRMTSLPTPCQAPKLAAQPPTATLHFQAGSTARRPAGTLVSASDSAGLTQVNVCRRDQPPHRPNPPRSFDSGISVCEIHSFAIPQTNQHQSRRQLHRQTRNTDAAWSDTWNPASAALGGLGQSKATRCLTL